MVKIRISCGPHNTIVEPEKYEKFVNAILDKSTLPEVAEKFGWKLTRKGEYDTILEVPEEALRCCTNCEYYRWDEDTCQRKHLKISDPYTNRTCWKQATSPL